VAYERLRHLKLEALSGCVSAISSIFAATHDD
jgi:hypothetical protein